MKEVWLPINGYEGIYEVSSLGRIKSLQRELPNYLSGTMVRKEMILKLNKSHRGGYVLAKLSNNMTSKSYSVHRLVASAFIENPCNLPEVNHKDAVKSNNVSSNLEWCNRLYNQHHAIEMGLQIPFKGESHGMSKLTDEEVLKIRQLYKSNKPSYRKEYSYRKIGKMFNVTAACIMKAVKGQNWKHI